MIPFSIGSVFCVYNFNRWGASKVRSSVVGDLMCKVVIETPVNLSGAQKDLLKQLETGLEEKRAHHRPKETGFFDGVKKFFDDLKS